MKKVVAKLCTVEGDSSALVAQLEHWKNIVNVVGYSTFTREGETGVLIVVVWTFTGSRELVQSCGDIMFWTL